MDGSARHHALVTTGPLLAVGAAIDATARPLPAGDPGADQPLSMAPVASGCHGPRPIHGLESRGAGDMGRPGGRLVDWWGMEWRKYPKPHGKLDGADGFTWTLWRSPWSRPPWH